MENSVKMNVSGVELKKPVSENPLVSFALMSAAPIVIGAWSAACFVGLIVSQSGAAWSLIS